MLRLQHAAHTGGKQCSAPVCCIFTTHATHAKLANTFANRGLHAQKNIVAFLQRLLAKSPPVRLERPIPEISLPILYCSAKIAGPKRKFCPACSKYLCACIVPYSASTVFHCAPDHLAVYTALSHAELSHCGL